MRKEANEQQRAEIHRLHTKLRAICCEHRNVLMQLHEKEKEIERLKSRLRTTAQLGIAEIGAAGPESAESVVGRLVARIQTLKANIELVHQIVEHDDAELAGCCFASEEEFKGQVEAHGLTSLWRLKTQLADRVQEVNT